MKKYILALDQGTTSSRAILFDKRGQIAGLAQKEFTQIYPHPGWVEHDPREILSSQFSVITEVLAKNDVVSTEIASLGITNQRETIVVWDKRDGKPVYNAIVWQCRRTAPKVEEIKKNAKLASYIRENTGLVLDAYFSGTKIQWILDNVEGARKLAQEGHLLCGTTDSWLLWNMTQGAVHATDHTNASRTMLFNIHTAKWDDYILREFDIPASMLPSVHPSSHEYGEYFLTGRTGDKSIPICGIAGDQQSALFGQACYQEGMIKNTYGTGCFTLKNIGAKPVISKNNLLTTLICSTNSELQYGLEGSVFVAGALIQWLRDELRLVVEAADTEYFAGKVSDNGGVYIVPAFVGLGTPYWDMYARGTILGLTRGTNRQHIIRAALEAVAYQTRDLIEAMNKDSGSQITELRVDGGMTANHFLMQFQADILNSQVKIPLINETTALGAAYLAGLQVGFWSGIQELAQNWEVSHTFKPNMDATLREQYYQKWQRAVSHALGWLKEE